MKVLITGGAGFIGTNAALEYAKEGHEVMVFDNLSRSDLTYTKEETVEHNWSMLAELSSVSLINADVRNYDEITPRINDFAPDLIIHAAAQTGIEWSLKEPEESLHINGRGTLNVLEAARKADINPRIIYLSTNKVYGNNPNTIDNLADENMSIDHCTHTPYGISKLVGDLYMQDYARLYGLKTTVFRMSCIYGPHQFGCAEQGWISHFLISAVNKRPITIYGTGDQRRDVLYVSDLVAAFKAAYSRGKPGDVYNIGGGPENTLSLNELLDMIGGFNLDTELRYAQQRAGDQFRYVSDIRWAKEALGWEPTIPPKMGVSRTLNWVMKNKAIL